MNSPETTYSITFDPDTNTYRLWYDPRSDERITETVIRAVTIVTNTPPTDFDPLYDTIDPDALARLFTGTSGDVLPDTRSG